MSKVNYVLSRLYLKTSENNIKCREYFQAQMQLDWALRIKSYIILEIKRSEFVPLIAKV